MEDLGFTSVRPPPGVKGGDDYVQDVWLFREKGGKKSCAPGEEAGGEKGEKITGFGPVVFRGDLARACPLFFVFSQDENGLVKSDGFSIIRPRVFKRAGSWP